MTKKTILITGGTGDIGSHTAVQLLEADYQVIMLDNLSNSKADVVQRVEKTGISGWAQVMHGYTSNSDQAWTKLTYDFYYIKHFSFWLDLLIVFRTIRVIFSGFGAK